MDSNTLIAIIVVAVLVAIVVLYGFRRFGASASAEVEAGPHFKAKFSGKGAEGEKQLPEADAKPQDAGIQLGSARAKESIRLNEETGSKVSADKLEAGKDIVVRTKPSPKA